MSNIPFPILFVLVSIIGYIFVAIVTCRIRYAYYQVKGWHREVREYKHIEDGCYWPFLIVYWLVGFPVSWVSRLWLWNQRRKLVNTLNGQKYMLSIANAHFSPSECRVEEDLVHDAEIALRNFDTDMRRMTLR